MQKNISSFLSRGFTIIEIVLGIAMITMFLVSNTYYYKKILDVSHETTRNIQSGFLLEEGVESIKLMRDSSWATHIAPLNPAISYYLYWNGSSWTGTTTPQAIETVFTRTFIVTPVNRDVNDDIVASGGTLDPGTKKVQINVAWISRGNRATSTKSIETYITNLFTN